jgi:hypothetical protein
VLKQRIQPTHTLNALSTCFHAVKSGVDPLTSSPSVTSATVSAWCWRALHADELARAFELSHQVTRPRGGHMNTPKTIAIVPDNLSREIISIYDEVLTDWSVPATEFMVPTRYGVTHVTEAGPKDGPVTVLLHGMGFPAPVMWATLAPHSGISHRLIAPDTIGDVGKSLFEGDTKAPRSGVDNSHWLGDVLEGVAIGDGKVAIVGTSYGA